MEELGEVKIKLDAGGVVRNDTILEIEYEGLLCHYKVGDINQLRESLTDFLGEACYDFMDLWIGWDYQEVIAGLDCTLFTDDGEDEFYVTVPIVESSYEFYKCAFGLVVESLGYKVYYSK